MENQRHEYMLLHRYKMDLEYFWGWGNQYEGVLYFGNYKKHVRECINLWKKLKIKPDWFTAVELINFKNKTLCR